MIFNVKELIGFLLDLMVYEVIYNIYRMMYIILRIKIDILIDVFWFFLFGFNIRGCVFVIVDLLVLKYELLDWVIVFVVFFDSDCGMFDVEVWVNFIIFNWKEMKFIWNF